MPVVDALKTRQVLVPQERTAGRRDGAWLRRQAGFAAWSVQALLTGRVPSECFYFFGGIGDELLCTAVFRELRRRGQGPARMMSSRGALFENNPDVGALVPLDPRVIELAKRLRRRVVSLSYALPYEPAEDRHPAPPYPIIARMCELAGITGEVSLRPYLFLTDAEREAGKIVPQQVAIVSSGLSARHIMLNKQWSPERYQAVVDALRGRFNFVQIGDAEDPPLSGVTDMRGKTSLRESAAILSQSLLFVGHVGLLMHLARAVDCRGVIVYGGREHPYQSGYGCNENLYTPLPCSPCWKYNACDFDRLCMKKITPEMVCDAIERAAARAGEPLETDTYTIAGEGRIS